MIRRHAAVLAFFTLLGILTLYQPLIHHDTHVTGTAQPRVTDYFHTQWNYWWIRHALTTSGLEVYETDYVLAPYTSSLAYHTLAPVWFPLWAVIEPLAGPGAAVTGIMIAALALAGYALWLLLRREGVCGGLALAGGTMLALSPMMLSAVFWSNLNLLGWFWLPTLVLIWDRVTEANAAMRWRRALGWTAGLGLACSGAVLTDWQVPLFAAFVLGPFVLLTLWQAPGRAARLRLVGWGAVGVGWTLALLWVAGPLPRILEYDRDWLASTPAERAIGLRFPEGFVWHVDDPVWPVSLGAVILPLTLLALLIAWRLPNARQRAPGSRPARGPAPRWFWLSLVPVPLVLAAGASITVAGVTVDLPYRWLHAALGGMFRYPERFAPVILIPAAIFSLQTLSAWLPRRGGWRPVLAIGLLAAVVIDARALRPFPIQPLPPAYGFYEAMGREPYDYVVVEVPTGASSGEGLVGEPVYASLQYYGLIHGKRMINGHLSRVNPLHFLYLRTEDPLLSWLGGRRLLDPALAEPRLRQIIAEYPVGYVVVHADLIRRYTGESTVQEVLGYLNSLPDLLCPVWVEGDAVAYRTTWHPDGCPPRTPPEDDPGQFTLDVGASGDEGFLGWGWHRQEEIVPGVTARWTGYLPQAEVFAALPPGTYRATLAAQSFQAARALRVTAGDADLGAVTIGPGGLEAYTLPGTFTTDGSFLRLVLDYDAPVGAGGAENRSLALMIDWLRFERVE